MKKKFFLVFLAVAAAICLALGLSACGKSDNGTYYLFVDDEYVKSEYVIIDGKEWSNSDGMGGKLKIKDGKAYFYMDFFGEEVVWQQGEIGDGKLVLQGLSGTMTYYKEGKAHIHSYGDWHVTTQPTCTAAGEETRVCSCGEKEIRPVSALGHDTSGDDVTYILPTCQSKGSINRKCKRCGANVDEEIPIKPENHYIDEGKDTTVCSGCGTKLATSMALEISSNGKYAILKEAEGTAVIVPAVYHGLPVTSIDGAAFAGCTSLISITIPDSVTSIGGSAFSGCTSLTSVTIGNGVTSIGGSAFSGCTSLESITIPDSVTFIGYSAFYNCTALEKVYITSIKNWCNIDFDNGSSNPLCYAHNLYLDGELVKNLEIPEDVTSIGECAFYGTSLTSITIPNGVTSIGGSAFYNCTALERVNITSIKSWCNIDFDNGSSNPLCYAHNLYLNGELVKNLEISEDVTSIRKYAFDGCTSLESITIPDSVTSIGSGAFQNCNALESITIPNSVTSIGGSAFYNCTALESITIPDGVTEIGNGAFGGCTALESVTIGNGVTEIGGSAFEGCTTLTSITIPDSVTSIGSGAFQNCNALESITIPNSVTSIGGSAFYNCTSLTSVTIGNGVTSIGYEAFSGCTSLTSITIPNSVTSIGNYAFSGCTSLESITIPDSVTSIGNYAFRSCTALESVTIGNGVTYIGREAFDNCTALERVNITSIKSWCNIDFYNYDSNPLDYAHNLYLDGELAKNLEIPEDVTSIRKYAFDGCTSLASITIPDSVTEIGDGAFLWCAALEKVYITSIKSWCNIDFDNGSSNPLDYAHNLYLDGELVKNLEIPEDVTSIRKYAFYDCTSLESITIPDSVTEIDGSAFYDCTSLTSVTIGNGVTSIGGYVFLWCTSLERVNITSIKSWCNIDFSDYDSNPLYYAHNLYLDGELVKNLEIPEDVTSIGNYAFRSCTALTSVTIGNGVTSIGQDAFSGCTSLTSVTIGNGVTEIGGSAFEGCTALESIIIPDSVTSIGDDAFNGCTNLKIATIPALAISEIPKNSLQSVVITSGDIGGSAFYNRTSLESVTIGNGVTSIGDYAFYNCTLLESITIPDSVSSIGNYAFRRCTSLESVTIGDGVTSIGNYAFDDCDSLTSVTFKNTVGWKAGNTTVDVTNTARNAGYLTATYSNYTWQREG